MYVQGCNNEFTHNITNCPKSLRVRIWVKERLYWGRKKFCWEPGISQKMLCGAGRVVFFSFLCKHFFSSSSFISYLIFEQSGQLGILTSYLGRFLVQCYKVVVVICLKKSVCIPCWQKFEKLSKTFSYENDERSHAITKTTHLYFTNSLISR